MNKSLVIKRLLYEYKNCVFDDINIKIDINEENIFIWNILIIPNDGFYKDIPLNFDIHIPDDYPITYDKPKIYSPYFIKNTNYRNSEIKHEFVLCINDLWNWDFLNIRSILINLYWYFNNEYVEYPYNNKYHIFYNRGVYDSEEITTYSDANIIINNLINDVIEYNKDKPKFSKYLKHINKRIFRLRKRDINKIKTILKNGFSKYSKKNTKTYASATKNDIKLYDTEIKEFIECYYKNDPNYKIITKNKINEPYNETILHFVYILTGFNINSYYCKVSDLIKQNCICHKCNFIKKICYNDYLTFDNIYNLLCYDWYLLKYNYTYHKLWYLIDKFGYHPDLTKKKSKMVLYIKKYKIWKNTNKKFYLEKLPVEILDKIINQLDIPTKYKLRITNKYLNKIVSCSYHWERHKLHCYITKIPFNKNILGLMVCKREIDRYTLCDKTVIGHTKHCDSEFNITPNYISNIIFNDKFKEDNVFLPLIINNYKSIIQKKQIEHAISKIYYLDKFIDYNKHKFSYKIVHRTFIKLFVDIIFNGDKFNDMVDIFSQVHFIYLKMIEWYPNIKKEVNNNITYILSHIDYSLKENDLFEMILLCGMSDDYNWYNIKDRLKKEVFKKIFRLEDKYLLLQPFKCIKKSDGLLTDNIVWYSNYNEIEEIMNYTSSYYNNTHSKSTKKRYIDYILYYLYIVEIIMRRDSFKMLQTNYAQHYGFLKRNVKKNIVTKLNNINNMKHSYKILYTELSTNDKWLSTRQIYNILQNYYICALKNRYIQNLNDNMNLYYIEDNKNSEYEMLSYYKK